MVRYDVVSTEYVTVEVREDGKEINIRLNDGVKISRHQNQLRFYVEKLHEQGIKRINADQITSPTLISLLALSVETAA